MGNSALRTRRFRQQIAKTRACNLKYNENITLNKRLLQRVMKVVICYKISIKSIKGLLRYEAKCHRYGRDMKKEVVFYFYFLTFKLCEVFHGIIDFLGY